MTSYGAKEVTYKQNTTTKRQY